MTAFVLAALVLSFAGTMSTAWAQIPQHIWSQRFGDEPDQHGESVAVDASGNVVATGRFNGTVDFGGGPLTSAGSIDIFVAKFDGAGNHVWSQRFGDESAQAAWSIAVDGSGNVIVTGYLKGTVEFGGGPLTSAGGNDIFVAKFDGAGNHVWSQRFGDELEQIGTSVAVSSSGNVIVTGMFDGTVDFGGGPLANAGLRDIFVAKFDGAGNHVWSQRFGDEGYQHGGWVAVDGSGNVIVTGIFAGTVDFGGGPLTSAGTIDIFVAKFDGAGSHVWSQRFGNASGQYGEGIAVDSSGNVIVTGRFQGTVDFGGGPLTSAGSTDFYVAKLDGSGNHVWSQRFGDEREQVGRSVAVDASGNVTVTGHFEGTVDFGSGPLTSAGSYDVYVANFDGSGNHVWSQRFGDESEQIGTGVAVNGAGNVIVMGYFQGTVDFGGGPLTSSGGDDIFVAKFTSGTTPTLLQDYLATITETGIEISWRLAEAGLDMGFHVLRAQGAGTIFQAIYNANIVQQNLSFTVVDNSCLPATTYCYRVDVSDEDGWRTLFETEGVTTPETKFALNQNHPNPFNPMTAISFVLPEEADVNLSIFNIEGRRIRTLVDKALPEGLNEAAWDGRDAAGNLASSGVYLYRLTAGKKVLTKKMVLLK